MYLLRETIGNQGCALYIPLYTNLYPLYPSTLLHALSVPSMYLNAPFPCPSAPLQPSLHLSLLPLLSMSLCAPLYAHICANRHLFATLHTPIHVPLYPSVPLYPLCSLCRSLCTLSMTLHTSPHHFVLLFVLLHAHLSLCVPLHLMVLTPLYHSPCLLYLCTPPWTPLCSPLHHSTPLCATSCPSIPLCTSFLCLPSHPSMPLFVPFHTPLWTSAPLSIPS